MDKFIWSYRYVHDHRISMPWSSLYIPIKIETTSSSVLSDYFSSNSMTRLVSSSKSPSGMVYNSLSSYVVFPFSFSFLDINSSYVLSKYRNNSSIPSYMDFYTQGQYSGLIQILRHKQGFWVLTRGCKVLKTLDWVKLLQVKLSFIRIITLWII